MSCYQKSNKIRPKLFQSKKRNYDRKINPQNYQKRFRLLGHIAAHSLATQNPDDTGLFAAVMAQSAAQPEKASQKVR